MIEKGFLLKEKKGGTNENIIIITDDFLNEDKEDSILSTIRDMGNKLDTDFPLGSKKHKKDNLEDLSKLVINNEKNKMLNKNLNISQSVIEDLNCFLEVNFSSKSVREKERIKFFELLNSGKSSSEILDLGKDLIENGILSGQKCDRPFAYLTSGAYEKILQRINGIKDFDPSKVYTAIARFNTREPLPEDFAKTLTSKELDWLQERGGRATLGLWPQEKIKKELDIL